MCNKQSNHHSENFDAHRLYDLSLTTSCSLLLINCPYSKLPYRPSMLERLFLIIFPIALVVFVGYLYGRYKIADQGKLDFTNKLNMDVFIPALILSVLSAKSFELMAYQQLAIATALIVIGSGIILLPLSLLGINLKTFIPPMMFNNSGNMGIPLIVLAFGEQALPAAVLLFIVSTLLHFTLGIYILDRHTHPLRLLKMPIIQATLAGLLISALQWHLPTALAMPVEMLGQIAVPLMLFTLGVRLTSIDFADWKIGTLGALLCPLSGIIIALTIRPFLSLSPDHFAILLTFAAMPPAVLNYMLAEQYQQQPKQVAAIVLIGNLFAVIPISLTLAYLGL